MTDALDVMDDTKAPITQVPVHANVMALIKALDEPVPWALLIEILTQLHTTHPEVALPGISTSRLEATTLDVIRDLRSLGLLTVGPDGSHLTGAAESTIKSWNGKFTQRLAAAKKALEDLGVLV